MKLQMADEDPGDQLNRAVQARSTEVIGDKQAFNNKKQRWKALSKNKVLNISLRQRIESTVRQ